MIDNSKVIDQIDTVLDQWKNNSHDYDPMIDFMHNNTEQNTVFFTNLISTIERFSHPNSSYCKNATKIRSQFPGKNPNLLYNLNCNLAGILQSLRDAYQYGYLQSIQELVHAD